MFVSFIALTTIQGHAGAIFLAFAIEQNVICLFNLIKGHKERERERAEKIEIWSLCTVADCTDKPFAGRVRSLCIQLST